MPEPVLQHLDIGQTCGNAAVLNENVEQGRCEPEIPPRNVNCSAQGKWVHYAKIAFEKCFLRKIRRGESGPFYERWVMEGLGIRRLTHAR